MRSSRNYTASRLRKRIMRVLTYAVLCLLAFIVLFPLLWLVSSALKSPDQQYEWPPQFIPWPVYLNNFTRLFEVMPIGNYIFNSTLIATGSVIGMVISSSLGAYAFARMRFRGRDLVFGLLVGSLMVPNAVILVPQYVLVQRLGWLSTYQGLIVPEAAMTFAFGVFLLRQFFLTIPSELEDAARIDGADPWQIFTRIVLPLSQPVLGALAIFAFRSAWNDFLWLLIAVNKPDMFPLPVALTLLRGAYASESYGPIMAGAVLSALPLLIVFLVANRRIVEGVRVSALKG